LLQRDNYARAVKVCQATEPLLVQRLDLSDTFYYIVPYVQSGGAISLVVAVDARTGVYRQSAVRSAGQGSIVTFNDRQVANWPPSFRAWP
jgi:hypothetical protein